MILNRKKAPEITAIDSISLLTPSVEKIGNTCFQTLAGGTQEVTRLDFVYDAGEYKQLKPLASVMCATLLDEGTTEFSANEIAAKFDYYGAYYDISSDKDHLSLVFYCINKYVNKILPIISSIVHSPVFKKEAFDLRLGKMRQAYLENNLKASLIARRHCNNMIFGNASPYGGLVSSVHFDEILNVDIIEHYQTFLKQGPDLVVLSGNPKADTVSSIREIITGFKGSKNSALVLDELLVTGSQKLHVPGDQFVQSAIRIGRKMIGKKHPDYPKLIIANTMLGGYFGSRLMTNIREEKGLTYGINSSIVSLVRGGYWFIATEVNGDKTKIALNEIYKEIARLREVPPSSKELNVVKSYVAGQMLRSVDGVFAQADRIKSAYMQNLNIQYYHDVLSQVQMVTASEVMEVSEAYFGEDQLVEVVVGNM